MMSTNNSGWSPLNKPNKRPESGTTKGNTTQATSQPTVSPAGPAVPDKAGSGAGNVSSPAPHSGSNRASYVPQFSAATQMILQRMRGEAGGLAAALASAGGSAAKSKGSGGTYASMIGDKLVSVKQESASASPSSPSTTTPATLRLPMSSTSRSVTLPSSSLVRTNKNRKRAIDESSEASSLAEASDYGEGIKRKILKSSTSNTPTTTKSGRHILKPDTYDPAAEDNMKKRNQLGKRTPEQALCKKCTRMHSPATNQMVFCDGCNDPWHQRCHEPWIGDEVVKDTSIKWYCTRCAARRERLQPKKKMIEPTFGPLPKTTTQEKRAFFTSLPPAQLVDLLLRATELHPEMPIFPLESTPRKSGLASMPRGLFAGTSTEGLFSRGDANPTGQLNFIRKIPANAKKSTIAKARAGPGSLQSKTAAQAQRNRSSGHQLLPEEEDASFTKLWPKPGMGMYSRLMPDDEDDSQLVDGNDHNSFSVIVYDERGKKIEENGVKF